MTASELQDIIFNKRIEDGDVSLASIPTLNQLNWLLFINPDKDYTEYTPEQAMEEINLYITYQYKKRGVNDKFW